MRDYLKEMQEHYAQVMSAGTGEKKKVAMSFCPTTWNKPCKLCDACKEVLFNQNKHAPQKIEATREINRKPKFYANVIKPGAPSEVLLFEYGKTIGDKLGIYEMDNSSDLKGFTNPKTGRNMVIVRYPNPDKRKTRYDVEPRLNASAIVDMAILDKLYNLDDVPNLLKAGVQPLYQSKLTDQRTEIRWLPFWDWRNHPELVSVFQVKYFIHYHISEDELEAINRGEFNPLSDAEVVEAPAPRIPTPSPVVVATPTIVAPAKGVSLWDDIVSVPAGKEAAPQPSDGVKPACFGTFDEGEPVCVKKCGNSDRLEKCKTETESLLAKRRQARNLYK